MTATIAEPRTTATAKPSRAANVALWALQVLLALAFGFGGVNKVAGEAQTVAGFRQIGLGDWFRYLIGALELAGAAALLIPILSGLAALAFTGLMIGAIATQIVVFDGELVQIPAVFLVLVAVVAWGRRRRTAQLAASLTRSPSDR